MAFCFMTGRAVSRSEARHQTIDYRGASLFLGLTVLATLLMDQKIAEIVGGGSEALLGLLFVALLFWFVAHEKSTSSPMINLSFFKVRIFGFGSIGLLMCCITQGLVTFVAPFYLQDVLKLTPTFMGVVFLVPSLLSMVVSPVSGVLTDRFGARLLLIMGVVILMIAFLIGTNLHADSHWILPAILLALTGTGTAFFNTPSQAVMIGSLPKENWGTAIGIINGIFGLGQMLGISLSGIFLTLAFRYYSGIPGTTPDAGDTHVFVASMNVTYLFAFAISFIPLATSMKMKKNS